MIKSTWIIDYPYSRQSVNEFVRQHVDDPSRIVFESTDDTVTIHIDGDLETVYTVTFNGNKVIETTDQGDAEYHAINAMENA